MQRPNARSLSARLKRLEPLHEEPLEPIRLTFRFVPASVDGPNEIEFVYENPGPKPRRGFRPRNRR